MMTELMGIINTTNFNLFTGFTRHIDQKREAAWQIHSLTCLHFEILFLRMFVSILKTSAVSWGLMLILSSCLGIMREILSTLLDIYAVGKRTWFIRLFFIWVTGSLPHMLWRGCWLVSGSMLTTTTQLSTQLCLCLRTLHWLFACSNIFISI